MPLPTLQDFDRSLKLELRGVENNPWQVCRLQNTFGVSSCSILLELNFFLMLVSVSSQMYSLLFNYLLSLLWFINISIINLRIIFGFALSQGLYQIHLEISLAPPSKYIQKSGSSPGRIVRPTIKLNPH